MARSLRDELLKAGLVTDEQAARAERGSRQSPKPAANPARKSTHKSSPKSTPKSARDRTSGESRGRPPRRGARHAPNREPRGLRESRQPSSAPAPVASPAPDPEERVRQLNVEIRRILDAEAEKAEPESDTPYHFVRGDRLKRLYVNADQRKRLVAGELAIVGFRGRHHLVPRRAGERVLELRPEVFVFIETGGTGEAATDATVDGYEGYEVPDSLVW